ncbi:MAG: A/G-specific adenine glycosylase [Phycisphaerae bacterium]|nr:A/G-specific adenine glycosylase [Phycisphaerae bacterium]
MPAHFTATQRSQGALRRALLCWFRANARDLPWRRTRNPYRIWLSEIMLQQTRVEAVLPYYRRFLRALPTVRRLAGAREDTVLKLWEGLGYYSRARNLRAAAKIIIAEHKGRFPRSYEAILRLPGIGRYTAGAIASIAFGQQTAVVDGNVKRVLARLCAIEDSVDEAAVVERMWGLAEALVPARHPGDWNQALMELGARICTPRGPQCPVCPVQGVCLAHKQGRANVLPRRRPRKPVPHYDIVAGVIERNGRVLIGRRPAKGLLGGLWEFPGGKREPGETDEAALSREIHEELGLKVAVEAPIATVEHAYSHFAITLRLYGCRVRSGRVRRRYHTAVRWVTPNSLRRFAFPAANYKCMDQVSRRTVGRTGATPHRSHSRRGTQH